MKKVNKIMMAIVAILLSLVLISTSLVSGIFAKFVIKKDASVKVTFKNLGVTLYVFGSSGLKDVANDIEVEQLNGSSATVTLKGVNIKPGDVKNGVINFALDGTLNLDAYLTTKVKVNLDDKFIMSDDKFESLDTDTAYMPLIFKVCTFADKDVDMNNGIIYDANNDGVADYVTEGLTVTESTDYDGDIKKQLEINLQEAICGEIDKATHNTFLQSYETDSDGASIGNAKGVAKDATTFFQNNTNGVSIGLEWPLGDSSDASDEAALRNIMDTYLAEQFEADEIPITITFTFILEQ